MEELTTEILKELFNYSEGELYWKEHGLGRSENLLAGHLHYTGYVYITVKRQCWSAHRLIWIYHGKKLFPGMVLDHIDGCPSNNKIENLRQVTFRENMANSKKYREGKTVGAYYRIKQNDYYSSIRIKDKKIFLGAGSKKLCGRLYKTASKLIDKYKSPIQFRNLVHNNLPKMYRGCL